MRKVLFIFGQLTDKDVAWLAGAGRRRRVARGAVLIRQGTPVDTLYVVLEGELDVVAVGGGTERRLARLQAGEVVGEMSFIDARPPSATVRAASDAILYAIPKARLQAGLDREPAFAARFYKAIATFLSDRVRRAQGEGAEVDELDDNVLDRVDRAGARFDDLGRHLLDE
jgi:CRP-like cAMP-binding protein